MTKKVAVLSIDVDLRHTTNSPMDDHPISYVSVVTEEEVFFLVTESFYNDSKTMREFFKLFDDHVKNLGLDIDPHINVDFRVVRTGLEAVRQAFQYMHDSKVDIVSVWNLHFDASIIQAKAEYVGYDLGKLLCSRSDADEEKSANYRIGPRLKAVGDGKVIQIAPQQRKSVLSVDGRFTVHDSLYYYAALRPGVERESYTLLNIMNVEMGFKNPIREMMPDLKSKEWLVALQRTHPSYAYLDSIILGLALLVFENKTKDLSEKLEPYEAEVERKKTERRNHLAQQ